MPLRDVTHVVFDRGIGTGPFNEAAALEAYHLVAKMDDADAAEFVFHVVNEVVENAIVENRDAVQKHLDGVIAKSLVYADLDAVAEGLNAAERAEVKKQLLQAVSKAADPDWDPKEHPRGPGGRFRVDPHHKIDKPESERLRTEGKADIPNHPDFGDMTKEQKERYRGQYAQIASKLAGALNGEKDVILHYADGSEKKVSAASANKLAEHIAPHAAKNVVGVSVEDYKPTIGGRVTDLTTTLGSAGMAGAARLEGDKAKVGRGNVGLAEQWYSAHPTNSSQQTFNRIGAGSEVLGAMAGGSTKMKAAAAFGSFVGQHGPQAEQVFGPPTRRMAYRYRGTERRPARDLVSAYSDAVQSAKSQSGRHTPEQNALRPPSWSERAAGREQIIGWLQQEGRAPSRALSNLQLAAGHTPPSEGVLLNADGQIVATAVGAGDDWYLPFNLRHLGALKGGEYIRSRSTGGLTTEDIYTGLMAGARKVTVVSRSGVYTLEFDPELRGGRRNNDKALRMSQRYGELLDAVQSGKVERQPLSQEAQREIAAEVDRMYGGSLNAADRRTAIAAMVKERKDNPSVIDAKIAELAEEQDAIERERELVPDERADFTRRRLGLESQKEYFFRLNGLGYKAAQEALKEQFPYHVADTDTTWHLNSQVVGRNDPGYVEPGALRPTAARANLFGGAIGPEGGRINEQKVSRSARTADRARPFVDRYGDAPDESGATERSPDEPKGPSGGGGAGMPAMRTSDAEAAAAAVKTAKMREAAAKVHAGIAGWGAVMFTAGDNKTPLAGSEELYRYSKMDADTFAQAMRGQGAPEKFHAAVLSARALLSEPDGQYPGRDEFAAAMGPKKGGAFDYSRAVVSPKAIYDFPDANPLKLVEAGRQPLALNPSRQAADASPVELEDEAILLGKLDEAIADAAGAKDKMAVVNQLLGSRMPTSPAGVKLIEGYVAKPDLLRRGVENIQRQRAANEKRLALPVGSGGGGVPASPEVQAYGATQVRKNPSAEQWMRNPGFDWNRPESEWPA